MKWSTHLTRMAILSVFKSAKNTTPTHRGEEGENTTRTRSGRFPLSQIVSTPTK